MRAFRSEWVKFLRLGQILGSWGTMVGFAIILAAILFANAGPPAAPPAECIPPVADQAACAQAQAKAQQRGPTIPVPLLEGKDGAVFAFQATGQLLGIIALVIAAANLATEYTSGTLKVLLVREPRRTVFLAGKILAVATFVTLGIAITLAASMGTSVAFAAARGISMSAWWTADGAWEVAKAFGNVTAAAWVWGLLGTMLAAIFRNGFPAIGIGIAYPLVVEQLLGLALPDVVKWMPGSVLGTFTAGHTAKAFGQSAGIDYVSAAILVLAYGVAFLLVPMVLLARRDVT